MLLRKTIWLVLGVFLLTGGVAQSQTTKKNKNKTSTINSSLKWRVIDGFRSAKFGMTEKQVLRAIVKDFKISNKKVERLVTSRHKTTALIIHTPKLTQVGGPADIVYFLGYKSKRLIQVNIDWGIKVSDNFNPQDLVPFSHVLRDHFLKKRYKKGYVVNARESDLRHVIFRGQDKKDRMILLVLEHNYSKIEQPKTTRLILSYYENVINLDHFKQ